MRKSLSGVVLLLLGLACCSPAAIAQQSSLSDGLVGTWSLVSVDYVRPDASRAQTFGENPTGIAFFDRTGHFIISVMRASRPAFAANDRLKGTTEENKATVQGTFTYFGTYTVNEPDRVINVHILGSSFPNWNGADQKRFVSLADDDLKLTNPVGSTGGSAEVVWKRLK